MYLHLYLLARFSKVVHVSISIGNIIHVTIIRYAPVHTLLFTI